MNKSSRTNPYATAYTKWSTKNYVHARCENNSIRKIEEKGVDLNNDLPMGS